MLFEGDQALKKISVLSGGEKSRVLLGKMLVSAANLLLLDEPTNHLDMESIDSLVEAIDAFDGAVVLATHSEMILHALAERLIVFDGGGPGSSRGPTRISWKGSAGRTRGWRRGSPPVRRKSRQRAEKKELKRIRAEGRHRTVPRAHAPGAGNSQDRKGRSWSSRSG